MEKEFPIIKETNKMVTKYTTGTKHNQDYLCKQCNTKDKTGGIWVSFLKHKK